MILALHFSQQLVICVFHVSISSGTVQFGVSNGRCGLLWVIRHPSVSNIIQSHEIYVGYFAIRVVALLDVRNEVILSQSAKHQDRSIGRLPAPREVRLVGGEPRCHHLLQPPKA